MFGSWVSVLFLTLMTACVVLAWLVRDWRMTVGVLTLVLTWSASLLIRYNFGSPPPLLAEVMINLVVIYVFFQLHFWAEGEEMGPVWPVFIVAFELFIFMSHVTRLTMGAYYYALIVNILYGAELVFIIGTCIRKLTVPQR